MYQSFKKNDTSDGLTLLVKINYFYENVTKMGNKYEINSNRCRKYTFATCKY